MASRLHTNYDASGVRWVLDRADANTELTWSTPVAAAHALQVIRERQFSLVYQIAKRSLDIAVAAVALVVLAPLFLIVAGAIRLDSPGPAFFVQPRVGQGGRVFKMLKFRTMVTNTDIRLGDVSHKMANDPRVTRVGTFLRKSSIDELPQLVNILFGRMSLVGPRPELVEIMEGRYETWQYARLLVPQGLTGWWQVTGRGTKLLCEHTEDDLYYIGQASFWFDLKILVMTVRAVIRREGAF